MTGTTRVRHVVTCLSVPSCGDLYAGPDGDLAETASRRHAGELRGGPVPKHSVITRTVPDPPLPPQARRR